MTVCTVCICIYYIHIIYIYNYLYIYVYIYIIYVGPLLSPSNSEAESFENCSEYVCPCLSGASLDLWHADLISCRLNLLLIARTPCRAISSAWNHLHKIIPEQDSCSSDAGKKLWRSMSVKPRPEGSKKDGWFSTSPFSSLSSNTQKLCSAAGHPFPRGPQPDSVRSWDSVGPFFWKVSWCNSLNHDAWCNSWCMCLFHIVSSSPVFLQTLARSHYSHYLLSPQILLVSFDHFQQKKCVMPSTSLFLICVAVCVCVSFAFFGSNSRSLLYFTMSIENYGMSIPKHSHHSIDFSTLIVFSPRFYPFSISPFASGGSRPALSMRERRKRSSALNSSCATCPRNSKEPTRNKWRNQASADANGGSSSVESVDFAVWVASNDASEATTELGLLRVCSVFHPGTLDCYLYRSVQDWARTLTRTVAFLSYKHCPFLSCNSRHGAVASLTASRASSLDFWRGEDLSVRASKQRESEMFARVNACNTAYVSDTSWK